MLKKLENSILELLAHDTFGDGHPEDTWLIVKELPEELELEEVDWESLKISIKRLLKKGYIKEDTEDDLISITEKGIEYFRKYL